MPTRFDHLVIGAADLAQGVEYVRAKLGVEMPFGGRHRQMGTHNCLARLSDSTFLEILAIDPEAEPVEQPRWFGLDNPHVTRSLASGPRLLTWVVNCDDITAVLEQPEISFGLPRSISRGELRWYFGVPDDGRLIGSGLLPYIISWQTETHPASGMADLGLHLNRLKLLTPFAEWTARQLEAIGAEDCVEIEQIPNGDPPRLEAELETPRGTARLSSND